MTPKEATFNRLMKIKKRELADNLASFIDLCHNYIYNDSEFNEGWIMSRKCLMEIAPTNNIKEIIEKIY